MPVQASNSALATLTSPLNFMVSNILAGNNVTIDLTNHAGKLSAIRIHAAGGGGDAGGTNARQFGTITLTNLSGTGALTNVVSLSTSNATSKPITNSFVNGVLELLGLEGGANISLSVNGSNIVITAAGGGSTSLQTNNSQFAPEIVLRIKDGAFMTNMNFWGDGTNNGSLTLDGNLLPLSDNVYNLGSVANAWSAIVVKGVGIRFVETGGGTDNILMRAPSSIGTSYALDMPNAQGGNGQVMTNNGSGVLGWWTPMGSLTTNENQFLGVPLSIKSGAQLTNVTFWESNALLPAIIVTNQPGGTIDLATMLTTNAAGLRVTSNGAVVVHGVIGSTTNSFEVRRSNNAAAIFGVTHSNTVRIVGPQQAGYGATLVIASEEGSTQNNIELYAGSVFSGRWRSDNAGNQIISAGSSTAALNFNYDDGSGEIGFGSPGLGNIWRLLPSSAVAAWHGGTLRRGQITNLWDLFMRSNIVFTEILGGSDTITIGPPAGASTYALKLPTTNSIANQGLFNDGSGNLFWKDDATGGGGGGLTTNANQFGASVELTIKAGLRLTNVLAYELENSAAALVITQHIGSATNALEIVSSNKEPVIKVTSNSTFWVKGVTGRTNDGFVVARTNGAATLMVRSNDLTVATNVVVYPLGDEVGVPYTLFSMTNSSILTNKTTSATIISNYWGRKTLPANFWTPGKRVHLKFRGSYFSPAGTFTWTNAVFFGSTMIASNLLALNASVAGDVWEEEIDIVCRNVGASGTLMCLGMCFIPSTSGGSSAVGRRVRMASGAVTVDTTAAADIDVTFHPSATTRALEIYVGHGTVYP